MQAGGLQAAASQYVDPVDGTLQNAAGHTVQHQSVTAEPENTPNHPYLSNQGSAP